MIPHPSARASSVSAHGFAPNQKTHGDNSNENQKCHQQLANGPPRHGVDRLLFFGAIRGMQTQHDPDSLARQRDWQGRQEEHQPPALGLGVIREGFEEQQP